jgi:hypothetical protein
MGGSYNKDGRRKDSKKGSKRKLPQDQWEDQELDGRMWFRGMHYYWLTRGWRRRATNRDECRRLVMEAKGRKRL